MDTFDRAWVQCAEKGLCDALGGAEYRRVRSAWDQYGAFGYALQFIVNSANLACLTDSPPADHGGNEQ